MKDIFNYSKNTLPPDFPHVLQYQQELHNIIYFHHHSSHITHFQPFSSPCLSSRLSSLSSLLPSSLHNELRLLKGVYFSLISLLECGLRSMMGGKVEICKMNVYLNFSILSVIGVLS